MITAPGFPGELPDLAEKFRGALVGAAVGDALGAQFEGMASVRRADLERETGTLKYTDDTHMTLGMAQSLVEKKGFDGPHMAALFAQNFMKEPWRGYGTGPPQVFLLLKQGVPWDQASGTLFGGRGSFGNGAAMRIAPAALLAYQDMERVKSLAHSTAIITHAHELGSQGAVLQGCAIALALREDPSTTIDHSVFLEALSPHVHSPVYVQKLERVNRLLSQGDRTDLKAVIDRLGNGIEAHESVPTAVYAFLRHPQSFKDTVTFAISLGGDTDTIGSMAGALTGAHLGLQAIPPKWRQRVEGSAQLQDLADSLLALARGTGS